MKQSKKDLQKSASRFVLSPAMSASHAIDGIFSQENQDSNDAEGLDFSELSDQLQEQNELLRSGDINRIEAMLLDQAHVLQSLFTVYTMKMAKAEYISKLEPYAKIALKAQNQCRQTLATLGELKNPKRTTFIKQQNNANNQQINQLDPNQENSKKIIDPTNELMEQKPNERLDFRTTKKAVGNDQEMETVATVNRAKNRSR